MGNWAFADLADKITYKAQDAGIPVYRVDPAYTSQTCSVCGHCARANRPSQARFKCTQCGFEANADHNAAINIGARAAMSIGLLQPAFG
jgi:transposase